MNGDGNGKRTNWRSTLGGAVFGLGTFLFGGPIALSVCGLDIPKPLLTKMVVAGFLMQGFGGFFAHLFGADAKTVNCIKEQVNENTDAVSVMQGNTPPPIKKG